MGETPWSRIREQNSVYKEFLEIVGSGSSTGSVLVETNCSFRHDTNKRGKMTQPNPSPNSFMQQSVKHASRTRSPRGRSPSGTMARLPCKDHFRGTCTNPFCEKLHPPECLFYKSENGCRFGEKCSYAHRQVDERPSKKSQKNGDKNCAVAMLKITRQLGGCVSQDMEPPKSTTILRKSSNKLKPIRCVKFTKAMLRHAKRNVSMTIGLSIQTDICQIRVKDFTKFTLLKGKTSQRIYVVW